MSVAQDPTPLDTRKDRLDGDGAELALADGRHWLRMDRRAGSAVFHGPVIAADDLVHPYLWPVASVFSRWLGREALHAGAVTIHGGAWVLIGPKEAGKSTLMAAHAARGGAVLADDLVVVDGLQAFAGPRCLDLRHALPDAPSGELRSTRAGTRLRMALAPVPPCVPLHGWIFLNWGATTELQRVPATTCLERLARWRAWGELPSEASTILSLVGRPAYDLVRPRRWSSVTASLALLDSLEAR